MQTSIGKRQGIIKILLKEFIMDNLESGLNNDSEKCTEILEKIKASNNDLNRKERLSIPLQKMPEQQPEIRARNFNEVTLGYSPEKAVLESARCISCPGKPCVQACPVGIDIPAFLTAAAAGDFKKGISIIKKDNLLPAVCGRVCPQEIQCQSKCTVGKILGDVDESVSIGRIERFLADWERENCPEVPDVKENTGHKVAVVGSGPASLVVAADVRREGHDVTVFEALHKTGGVMTYGIPEFRLPKEIVFNEIDILKKMGVEFVTNFFVGRTRQLLDLLNEDGYDAVFIGEGAGLPRFMNIPGENLVGVFSANEYLTRVNLMRAFEQNRADTPIISNGIAVVVGGGNVAMDAARTALRMGADEVHVVYRRSEDEMPARKEEIHHAKEEGVIFHYLQNVIRCIGDENECLTELECVCYELGEPDSSGRPRPVEKEGSNFTMKAGVMIVAIGNHSNPILARSTPGLKCSDRGNILVDENMKTSLDRVYAAGDTVSGSATVILAMGDGRKAAASINRLFENS
jgi:glutamate synthase (NADPH/NADH) small chain